MYCTDGGAWDSSSWERHRFLTAEPRVQSQMTSREVRGEPIPTGASLLSVPLPSLVLLVPPDWYKSPDRAAHYHILGVQIHV
jgi:hypothetical protein